MGRVKSERQRAREHGAAAARRAEMAEASTIGSAVSSDLYRGTVLENGSWRPAFQTDTRRGYGWSRLRREKALSISDDLYEANPIYYGAVETKAVYVLGDGFSPQAQHPTVQRYVDDLWAVNEVDTRMPESVRELIRTGLQAYPITVGDDSLPRLGYLDPFAVTEIIPHPVDPRQDVSLVIGSRTSQTVHEFPILRRDRATRMWVFDPTGPNPPVIHVARNRQRGRREGMPEFMAGFGYFQQGADGLWQMLERGRNLNRIARVWTLKGAGPQQVDEFEKERTAAGPPKPNSDLVVSDSVSVGAFSFPLGSAAELADTLKSAISFCSLATGIPPHLLAHPEDVNRASGVVMNGPFHRMLLEEQWAWVDFWQRFITFAVDLARRAGRFADVRPTEEALAATTTDEERSAALDACFAVEVRADPIVEADAKAELDQLAQLGDELDAREQSGKVTPEEAIAIYRGAARHQGWALGADPEPGGGRREEVDAQIRAARERLAERRRVAERGAA